VLKDLPSCPTFRDLDNSGVINMTDHDTEDMGREERRERILSVLEDTGCAMKGVDIWRNAKLRGADFERRTAGDYLSQYVEEGEIVKVDSDALNDGELMRIDKSQRGHFIAASVYDQLTGDE
jgi:sporulation-control protein spo0M